MSTLTDILVKYQDKFKNNIKGGGIQNSLESTRDDFVDRIGEVSRHNRRFFWITVVMLLVVFVGSIAGIVYSFPDMNKVKVISAISGMSLAGMIYYMNNLWRQIVGIELAIAMSERLDPASMLKIINSLLAISKKVTK